MSGDGARSFDTAGMHLVHRETSEQRGYAGADGACRD